MPIISMFYGIIIRLYVVDYLHSGEQPYKIDPL